MNRKWRRVSLLSASTLVAGAVAVVAGDWIPYQRKVPVRCALPNYPYVRSDTTNPVSRETFTGAPLLPVILNEGAAAQVTGQEPRFWQLKAVELRDRQCAISQVTLWVQPDGEWRLTFTAEQNALAGFNESATPESRFLRNKFFVKVRAVGAEKSATDMGNLPLAGAEMFCIEIPPFWIERGERRHCSYRGTLPESDKSRWKYVDRLWVDLSWE